MQCTATNRQGQQCRRNSIAGGGVCPMQGGTAPQVRAAAKARILDLVAPALGVIRRSMSDYKEDRRSALAAARDILDRAGIKGEQPANTPWNGDFRTLTDEQL